MSPKVNLSWLVHQFIVLNVGNYSKLLTVLLEYLNVNEMTAHAQFNKNTGKENRNKVNNVIKVNLDKLYHNPSWYCYQDTQIGDKILC